MGLDMYVYTTNEAVTEDVDFDVEDCELLHQWRKHPNLHGLMQWLYEEKGGSNPEFNCATLLLNCTDLDILEGNVKSKTLPHTEGFFFGESDGSETSDDLEFIGKARRAIEAGLAVFYWAWF